MNIKMIRRYLRSKVGSKITVVYFGSRNRVEKNSGVLFKIYYNIFSIKLRDGSIKSFSFCDVLTKTVQIYI